MSHIQFFSADKPVPDINKRRVVRLMRKLFFMEHIYYENIRYVFCSDEYLLQLNKEYLKHDYFTDILTFKLSSVDQPLDGEVYISVERIEENAKLFKVPYENELLRVIIHGALHLCGYQDFSGILKRKMRQRESFYIELYELDSRET